MKVKCGRDEFDLNKQDIIFDNGACYQITTRQTGHGWNTHIPVLAKLKAQKLIKNGQLILVKEEMKYVTVDGKEIWYKYYRIAA